MNETRQPIASSTPASVPRNHREATGRQHAATTPSSVNLNIERLTLHGIAPQQQTAITRAIQHEFSKLVEASPDLDWNTLRGIDRITASDYRAGASPEEIGRHVAREIFRALNSARGREK